MENGRNRPRGSLLLGHGGKYSLDLQWNALFSQKRGLGASVLGKQRETRSPAVLNPVDSKRPR